MNWGVMSDFTKLSFICDTALSTQRAGADVSALACGSVEGLTLALSPQQYSKLRALKSAAPIVSKP